MIHLFLLELDVGHIFVLDIGTILLGLVGLACPGTWHLL